jgi:hypothetical protein
MSQACLMIGDHSGGSLSSFLFFVFVLAVGAVTDSLFTLFCEQYGLDTSEFPQNPSESRRSVQQNSAPPTEEKQSRCTIM